MFTSSRTRLISIVLLFVFITTLLVPLATVSAQIGATAYVNTGRLNIRTGPGVGFDIIVSVLRHTNLSLVGRNSDGSWAQAITSTGINGWVRTSLIVANVPISSLPITYSTQPPPTQPPPTGGSYYTVQPGDNLFRISLRFGLPWTTVAAANNIFNPSVIYVGQALFIPAGGTVPPPTGGPIVHTVAVGETLQIIAARYGTTWQVIAAANNLANPNVIFVGQRLTIRGSSPTPAPVPLPQTYVVQRGDNLTNIAARFGKTVQAIMTANNIANPDTIFPGQLLTIP
jgi:LysM repeat protein